MTKTVVVIPLHGMGDQAEGLDHHGPEHFDKVLYSGRLYKMVRRKLGAEHFDAHVAWHEIFFADIFRNKQTYYRANAKGRLRISKGWMRDFVMDRLTDAATYRKTQDDKDQVYDQVHDRVADLLARVEARYGSDIPVVLAAHSLGGHVMSNYIYDAHREPRDGRPLSDFVAGLSKFQKLATLRRFYTFGCNIPVFTFAYAPKDVHAISFPGPKDYRTGWWQNYFDRQDVLGYPLRPIGGGYEKLAKAKELQDHPIDAGWIIESWSALSHNAYWKDPDLGFPMAEFLEQIIAKQQGS